MTIVQLWIGDGRDEYHDLAAASILRQWPQPDYRIVIDDREHLLGFAGAIREAWRQVLELDVDYVAHLELDFTYNEPVDQDAMVGLLERHPHLQQVSLKRQPVNAEEKAAGDFVNVAPDDYTECSDEYAVWTQTRRFWTTNPSIYRASLCERGWPQESESEGKFAQRLFREHANYYSAIWGGKYDAPRVTHIGDDRAGHGY